MKKYKLNKKRKYYTVDYVKYYSIGVMLVAVYLFINVISPIVIPGKGTAYASTSEIKSSLKDNNRIIVPKLNLDVEYFTGTQQVLNKGAWHRFPERGNPKEGGNFILAAHRFKLDWTPWSTNHSSPFYNINKLNESDQIIIQYEGEIFEYKISKIYEVKSNDTKIEATTTENRLTLYTCTLNGSDDGRIVIEASIVN